MDEPPRLPNGKPAPPWLAGAMRARAQRGAQPRKTYAGDELARAWAERGVLFVESWGLPAACIGVGAALVVLMILLGAE